MRILTKKGYIDAVGLFYELDDKQLEMVRLDRLYFYDKELVNEFNRSSGKNAHFFAIFNNGDKGLIYKHLRLLLKDYKTISWWDKTISGFKLLRRKSCQQ